MKRLFFLFVFTFIGFGAFGYTHNNTHFYPSNNQLFSLLEYNRGALYVDTIPKKKRVDEWYIGGNTGRIDLDIGLNRMMFKDNFFSDIPYSGFGLNSLLPFEMVKPKYKYSLGNYMQITWTNPTKSYHAFLELSSAYYYTYEFNLYVDGSFRLAKSSHYMGSRIDINHSVRNDGGFPVDKLSSSIGLVHTYYSRIFGIRTRINTTLPILTCLQESANDDITEIPRISSPFFIDYFNPVVNVTLFFKNLNLSYTLNYRNINREFSSHRHITNSISIGYSISTPLDYGINLTAL